MASTEQFQRRGIDPLLKQAEMVFSQRRSRRLVIDGDIFGEPGWDLLLYAYIAQRNGEVCSLNDAAAAIDLGVATTTRWVDLLVERGLLIKQGDFFAMSEETETKLSTMFRKQISQTLDAVRGYWQSDNSDSGQLR